MNNVWSWAKWPGSQLHIWPSIAAVVLSATAIIMLAWPAATTWWFWDSFWPNLAATIMGVLLAVPIGLWFYYRESTDSRLAEEKHRKDLVSILVETFERTPSNC